MKTLRDLFFRPGTQAGLSYVADPSPILIRSQSARVRQFAGSDFPEIEAKIRKRFEKKWKPGSDSSVFQIASVPVLLAEAQFRRHGVMVGGRWLLNGANGDETLLRYMRQAGGHLVEESLTEALSPDGAFQPVPTEPPLAPDLPIAIVMRNGHNYYHFLTETMPQFAIIARLESRARIFVHLPDLSLLRPFVKAFIAALYPELAERVHFTDTPTAYEKVLTVYNHRHYLYQTSDPSVEAALQDVSEDDPWRQLSGAKRSRKYVMRSSVDVGLKLLRADALKAIAGMDLDALPKRVFVGREHAANDPRFRDSPGQDRLVAALQARGFDQLFMERLSPAEQIAAFHAADKIVAPHGAGLANMVFARRATDVVEIGNPQTQLHRWGDFLQNAHASLCRYHTVFADVNTDDPRRIPPISSGLRGASIGTRAIDRIMTIVD